MVVACHFGTPSARTFPLVLPKMTDFHVVVTALLGYLAETSVRSTARAAVQPTGRACVRES